MKKFYAKLLLFGEYTIIKGSAAFAMPYQRYSGEWIFSKNPTESNKILQQWHAFLLKQSLNFNIQLDSFKSDIDAGLSFQSDIPQGYGVGSSGALTAGFFDRYVTDFHTKKIDIFSLKNCFFQLEHFFHGGGSGIDPLICYLDRPIVFQSDGEIYFPKLDFSKKTDFPVTCFLIDTHIERKTQPLVQLFLDRCKEDDYNNKCTNELAAYTDNAIQALQSADKKTFLNTVKSISQFQEKYFEPMIPKDFKKIWHLGIQNEIYTLKLCGAGGGGFILGFTENWEQTQILLKDYDLQKVF